MFLGRLHLIFLDLTFIAIITFINITTTIFTPGEFFGRNFKTQFLESHCSRHYFHHFYLGEISRAEQG